MLRLVSVACLTESSLLTTNTTTTTGNAIVMPDGGGEMLVVKQAWRYGPPGEDFKVLGEDITAIDL